MNCFLHARVGILIASVLSAASALSGQTPEHPQAPVPPHQASSSLEPNYQVVFLRPHPSRAKLSAQDSDKLMASHMANIRQMAADGVLVAAGPMDDEVPTISGLFFFRTGSAATAQRIAEQDPTVTARRNTVDTHSWVGPAGIGDEYKRRHEADPKTPVNMGMHPLLLTFPGPQWEALGQKKLAVLAQHAAYIEKLKRDHQVAAAGPMAASIPALQSNTPPPQDLLCGMTIFKRIPLAKAQQLLAEDPAIKAGVFRAEWHQWWSAQHVLPE